MNYIHQKEFVTCGYGRIVYIMFRCTSTKWIQTMPINADSTYVRISFVARCTRYNVMW